MQVFVHPTPLDGSVPDITATTLQLIPVSVEAVPRANALADTFTQRGCRVAITLPLLPGTDLRTSAAVLHL